MCSEYHNDEVTFWLDMIQQWEKENAGPAPKRMYDALAEARAAERRAEDFILSQAKRPH